MKTMINVMIVEIANSKRRKQNTIDPETDTSTAINPKNKQTMKIKKGLLGLLKDKISQRKRKKKRKRIEIFLKSKSQKKAKS